MATDSLKLAGVGRSADPHAATREGGGESKRECTKEGACVTDRQGKREKQWKRKIYRKWRETTAKSGDYRIHQGTKRSPSWLVHGIKMFAAGWPQLLLHDAQHNFHSTKRMNEEKQNTHSNFYPHNRRLHLYLIRKEGEKELTSNESDIMHFNRW